MYNLKGRELHYQSVSGAWKSLKPMSVLKTNQFFVKYGELISYINKQDLEEEIWSLYVKDEVFQQLCNRCLEISGIEPDDCDAAMLVTFLFPHYDSKEEAQDQGLILSFNFGKSKAQKKANKKKQELTELIANLWVATESLEESLSIIDKVTPNELEELIKARNYLLKPKEERDRDTGFEKAMEIMKSKGMVA